MEYFIGMMVSLSALFVVTLIAVKSVLEGESLFKFFIFVIVAVFLCGAFLYCADMSYEESDRAISKCVNSGYTTALHNNDSWYCVTYGNEPKIIKLEGEQ